MLKYPRFAMSTVCYVQDLCCLAFFFVKGLLCFGFVVSSFCYVQCLLCLAVCYFQSLICLGFLMSTVCFVLALLCLVFVMSSVCLTRVCYVQTLSVQGLLCLVFFCHVSSMAPNKLILSPHSRTGFVILKCSNLNPYKSPLYSESF